MSARGFWGGVLLIMAIGFVTLSVRVTTPQGAIVTGALAIVLGGLGCGLIAAGARFHGRG